MKGVEKGRPSQQVRAWLPIDAKYSDVGTSGLAGDLKAGADLDVELRYASGGSRP